MNGVIASWKDESPGDLNRLYGEFDHTEPVLQARIAVLRVLSNTLRDKDGPLVGLQYQLTQLARLAIQAKRHQVTIYGLY